MIEWEKTESGECEFMEQVPEGAKVISFNGKNVEGFCESCSIPILDSDNYATDPEGVMLCNSCFLEGEPLK